MCHCCTTAARRAGVADASRFAVMPGGLRADRPESFTPTASLARVTVADWSQYETEQKALRQKSANRQKATSEVVNCMAV